LFSSNVFGQNIYEDEYIKVKGFINVCDSSLLIQIRNLSDSIMVLNGEGGLVFNVEEGVLNGRGEITLIRNIILPSVEAVSFRWLELVSIPPKGIRSFSILHSSVGNLENLNCNCNKNFTDLNEGDFRFRIEYLIIPFGYKLIGDITFAELITIINRNDFTLNGVTVDSYLSDCKRSLDQKGLLPIGIVDDQLIIPQFYGVRKIKKKIKELNKSDQRIIMW
tara:strand:- start:143 stop:805 length:663 start_codon:yes stop_codon:yes gene_type:complete